jgi:hypothetical protein
MPLRLEAEAAEKTKSERRKEAGLVAAAEEKGKVVAQGLDPGSKVEDEEVYLPDPDRIEEDEPALLVHALGGAVQAEFTADPLEKPLGYNP